MWEQLCWYAQCFLLLVSRDSTDLRQFLDKVWTQKDTSLCMYNTGYAGFRLDIALFFVPVCRPRLFGIMVLVVQMLMVAVLMCKAGFDVVHSAPLNGRGHTRCALQLSLPRGSRP